MSDWIGQNALIWKQIDFVFSDPDTTSLAWITCDSFRHTQTLLDTFKAHFPDATHLEHKIDTFTRSSFTQYFREVLPTAFFEQEEHAKFLHVFGLEKHVGFAASAPSSGLFAALNLEREILFQRFPFNIVFWTDTFAQVKAQMLAPDFWDWLTDKFHFEAPVEVAKAEREWMLEEKAFVRPEQRAELYHQISQHIGKLNVHEGREKLSLLEAIANNYQALQDYDMAAHYRKEVLKMQDLLLPSKVAYHLNELGMAYQRMGMLEQATQAYEESLGVFQGIDDRSGESRTINNLGQIYYSQGDFPQAAGYLKRSLYIQQKIGDRKGEGVTLNNLAGLALSQGDYPNALEYLERSLQIMHEIGDRAGEGTTLNNLSQIYTAQGDYPQALAYLERSLLIRQEIGERRGEGTTLNNLGRLYLAQGDYPQALAYLERSLQICQEIGNRAGEGATLNNLSQIYDAQGDYPQVLAYLERSLEISKEIGDIDGIATALHNLGYLPFERGDFQTALPFFVKAAAIWKQLGSSIQKHPDKKLAAIEATLGPEAYAATIAQLPKNEDPLDLSSLPQIQID